MSWSGGWFFLMAAEIFTVGARDFRLPGLGSYLQTAANQGNLQAVFTGLAALVLVIIVLDQFVWRPVLAWADKFKLEMTQGEEPPTSWFLDALSRSWLIQQFNIRVQQPVTELLDGRMRNEASPKPMVSQPQAAWRPSWPVVAVGVGLGLVALYGTYRAAALLSAISPTVWAQLSIGWLATFARVSASLIIALAWTIPLGVVIGTNRRLATVLQPIVQVTASIPATALFPLMLLALLPLPGGLNLVAVLLMLMGTQWYLLFNIIAGAAAIPQDLRYTTDLLRLSRLDRWRTLILPAIFPYIVTGAITASGGAWNASVVAEHEEFAGQTHAVLGIGAVISDATGSGNYALLLAATLVLVVAVVLINRTFWRWLYRLAEERFRME
jgi:NitT/TauT family transport system permease protein